MPAPNWKHPSDYPKKADDLTPQAWAWEFLRRTPTTDQTTTRCKRRLPRSRRNAPLRQATGSHVPTAQQQTPTRESTTHRLNQMSRSMPGACEA
jgi:hypothetical protein